MVPLQRRHFHAVCSIALFVFTVVVRCVRRCVSPDFHSLFFNHIMSHYYRFCALLFFAFSLTFLSGCGQKGPKVNYVEGIVTVDGTPIEGADVSFIPTQAVAENDLTGPLWASGRTDASGKYNLSTTRGSVPNAGTTAGEYKVTVSKMIVHYPPGGPSAGAPRFEYVVPHVFDEEDNAKISVTVTRGKNIFNFALKSDGSCEVTK